MSTSDKAFPWHHEHKATLPASPDQVFDALTKPESLRRWFADEVDVSGGEGEPFRFWGRHTFATHEAGTASQRITQWEEGSRLGFTWPIDGQESEVTIALEPKTGEEGAVPGTSLSLRHSFSSAQEPELIDDLWKLTMGNLDAFLRGGDGIVLPDFTDPTPEIRLSIVIDAPPDRVFSALIEPEKMSRWLGCPNAEVEPRLGGRYRYNWEYKVGDRDVVGGPTTILDYVENERLVTDWPDWRGNPDKPKTRVAWHLDDLGNGRTRVTLIHGEFPRAVDFSDYPFGWGWFLSQLKAEVEQKD